MLDEISLNLSIDELYLCSLIVHHRLNELLLRVHYEGTALRDRLTNRSALQQQHGGRRRAVVRQRRRRRRIERRKVLRRQRARVDAHACRLVRVDASVRVFADSRGGQRDARARLQFNVKDCNVVVGVGSPRIRGRRQSAGVCELARPHSHTALFIGTDGNLWNLLVPVHHERRLRHLVLFWQIEPNLKQTQRIRLGRVDQRKILAVNDASARRHPLKVTCRRLNNDT